MLCDRSFRADMLQCTLWFSPSKECMQDYYAARAGEYDQIYRKPER